ECNGNQYNWPANHLAGSNSGGPPMGAYLRLKSNVDISQAPPQAQIVLQAMKTYGCIIQENGTVGYLNGDANVGWDHTQLKWIRNSLTLNDLEFVDVSSLEISPNTAQASQSGPASISSISSALATVSAHHTNSAARAILRVD